MCTCILDALKHVLTLCPGPGSEAVKLFWTYPLLLLSSVQETRSQGMVVSLLSQYLHLLISRSSVCKREQGMLESGTYSVGYFLGLPV